MKESTIKYVIRDTSSYKVIATIKPYRLLTAKKRLTILDTRGYSTDEKERFRVDRYIDNEFIFTSFLPNEEQARKEEEEPTLEEPDYDNLDDLEEDDSKDDWDEIEDEMNDVLDDVKYREDNDNTEEEGYDNLDNLENYNNLRCLERLRD